MTGVYKITNSITGEFYVGSSKNVKNRWAYHRCPSSWNRHPNSRLYADMKKYGTDKFVFEVIEEVVDVAKLRSREQYYIELYQPIYNKRVANTGLDTTDMIEYRKQYQQSDKYKQYKKQYYKQYYEINKEKIAEHKKQYDNQYRNRICEYNGERLTLNTLGARFYRMGVEYPFVEAKKYLVENQENRNV